MQGKSEKEVRGPSVASGVVGGLGVADRSHRSARTGGCRLGSFLRSWELIVGLLTEHRAVADVRHCDVKPRGRNRANWSGDSDCKVAVCHAGWRTMDGYTMQFVGYALEELVKTKPFQARRTTAR